MSVTVLVGYRSGDIHRDAAWAWCLDRWREVHPGWQVRVADSQPGVWCRADAVTAAAVDIPGGVVVVADADCWSDRVADAVHAVTEGAAWAVPHTVVRRMSRRDTDAVLAGRALVDDVTGSIRPARSTAPARLGRGITVLSAEALRAVPVPRVECLAPGEDPWARALEAALGPCHRVTGTLWHLWHPPAPRSARRVPPDPGPVRCPARPAQAVRLLEPQAPPPPEPVPSPPVSVVIPYRASGDKYREAAYRWVTGWWQRTHPDWQVVVGTCPEDGPWRKGIALADGLARTDGRVVVYADADVWCDGVQSAVDAVAGGAAWATPHKMVHRLTADATRALITGARPSHVQRQLAEAAHRGCPAGGIVVAPREVHLTVPVDPLFYGWGQEDEAREKALEKLHGPCWRGRSPLWHLWHKPPVRQTRKWGSSESRARYGRYASARTQEDMRRVLADAQTAIAEMLGETSARKGARV